MQQTKQIDIVVNGELRCVPVGLTVSGLLGLLGMVEERVAVELDRIILRKPDWPATWISAGARLEIVQFVGGG